MKGYTPDTSKFNQYRQHLENLINPEHPLCKPAKRIAWDELETHFENLYHQTGRPCKTDPFNALLAHSEATLQSL